MTLLTDITFAELAMTAIALGLTERFILPILPESMVGPEGWLLKSE